jgi:hypothetical protein
MPPFGGRNGSLQCWTLHACNNTQPLARSVSVVAFSDNTSMFITDLP